MGEIPGPRRMLDDHIALDAIGLIAPHAGLLAMQEIGQETAIGEMAAVAAAEWISLVLPSTPICAFMPKCR
jgi:hypothetical protein